MKEKRAKNLTLQRKEPKREYKQEAGLVFLPRSSSSQQGFVMSRKRKDLKHVLIGGIKETCRVLQINATAKETTLSPALVLLVVKDQRQTDTCTAVMSRIQQIFHSTVDICQYTTNRKSGNQYSRRIFFSPTARKFWFPR